jgi:carboxyl-terminal processing protease
MSKRLRVALITVSCFLVFYMVLGGLLGKNDSSSDKTYRDLGVYSEVLSRIKSNYVTEPDLSKVTGGAVRGLLEALDPYSTYFSPAEYQDYLRQPDPGLANVGIFVVKRMGYARVISVLPGSPAEKAGVKAADLIDRVENTPTRELSVVQIQRLLAGPSGSTVTLTLVREARGEPQKFPITRAPLTYPLVVARAMESGAVYIRVATFNKGKAAEISAKLKELTADGADKVVLDLRNCAGGEMQEAVDTASLFLEKGLVGYLLGQRYPRQELPVNPPRDVCKFPLVVLINQFTAGPAELLASAILGNKRGDVVGTPSFGVGVFQKLIPLDDGSALLLSVAKYYGPDGKAIQDNGVTPNITEGAGEETASLEDENEPTEPEHFGDKDDLQLRRAIEILKQKSSLAKGA